MAIGRPREFDAERALDLATELFWRKGYEGTSLSDLTRTLGITRPSLYAAFGNKETLFLMALDRYEVRAGAYRVKALEAPTAYEVARQILHGVVNLHGDRNNPAGCMGVQSALVCGDDLARSVGSWRHVGGRVRPLFDGACNAPKRRAICLPSPIRPTSRDFSRF